MSHDLQGFDLPDDLRVAPAGPDYPTLAILALCGCVVAGALLTLIAYAKGWM